MKRQSLTQRILLPVLAVLLVMAPLTCLSFQRAATAYAYAEASDDLSRLQEELLPLIPSGMEAHGTREESWDALSSFLLAAGRTAHRMGGRASLIILGSEMQMIYPRSEAEREMVSPLAEGMAQSILTGTLPVDGDDTEVWRSGSGELCLVRVHELTVQLGNMQYLIAYCPVSQVSGQIAHTSLIVLALYGAFGLLVLLVLWLTIRSIQRALLHLGQGARQIGRGTYVQIQPAFSICELEALRLAANEMSEQLRQGVQSQRDFYQNISHELRSPLMSIGGYAQGIEQGVFPDPKAAARAIVEESTRLSGLVNSMLTLSRLERREERPDLSPLSLLEVLEDCLDRAYGQALQRGVSITVDARCGHSLMVWGEEELLGKVFDNLLSNAVRYARSAVSVTVVPAEGGTIRVCIADDGGGIAPEDLPRLFERCYRGRDGNFGLGLSIAQQAAALLGGTLSAANCQAGGAVFTAVLPLSSHAGADASRGQPEHHTRA